MTQLAGEHAIDAAGQDAFDDAVWPESETVSADGQPRLVIPVGDWGTSQVQIRFVVDDCPYVNFVAAGTSRADAMDYAERF